MFFMNGCEKRMINRMDAANHLPSILSSPAIPVMASDLERSTHSDDDRTIASLRKAEDELEDEWKRLACREGKAVTGARVIVFVALVCATATVTLGIRRYIRSDQRQDFESSFNAAANKILESFHNSVKRRLEAGTFPLSWAAPTTSSGPRTIEK
jgi:hypothetical protein